MANITKFTLSKREEFLEHLKGTGNVTNAAHKIGLSRQRLYDVRKVDAEFAKAWSNAFNEFLDAVEAEVRRRAIEGVEEPVFYQGQQVAMVRKYSDTLLMFYLKAKRPQFRDRQIENVPGGLTVQIVNYGSKRSAIDVTPRPQDSLDLIEDQIGE